LSSGSATFIVGHPRSGTSLLRALLDGHSRLLVLPFETHFLEWASGSHPVEKLLDRTRLLSTLLQQYPALSRKEVVDEIASRLGPRTGQAQRLTALVDAWGVLTRRAEWSRWVEKTPRHLYDEIPDCWTGSEPRLVSSPCAETHVT